MKVEKDYVFYGPNGRETLVRPLRRTAASLIIYHFMFGPGWKEGCPGCSFLADHIDGADLHLRIMTFRSSRCRARPSPNLLPFKRRMGWTFKWVSSYGSDFNYDYHVSATEQEHAAGSSSTITRSRTARAASARA